MCPALANILQVYFQAIMPCAQRAQFDAQLQNHREFRAAFRRHYREKKAVIEQLQTRLRESDRQNEQLRQEVEELRRAARRPSEAGSPATVVESPSAVPGSPPSAAVHAVQAAGAADLQTTRLTTLRALQPVFQQAASTGDARSACADHDVRRPVAAGRLATGSQRREDSQSGLRAVVPSTALPAIAGLRLAHDEDLTLLPASLPSSPDPPANAAKQPGLHGGTASPLGAQRLVPRDSLVSVSNRRGRVMAEEGRPATGRRPAEQPIAAEAQPSKGWKRKRGGGDNFMPDALPAALRTGGAGPPPAAVDAAGDRHIAAPEPAAVTSIPETPRASPDAAGNQEDRDGGSSMGAYSSRLLTQSPLAPMTCTPVCCCTTCTNRHRQFHIPNPKSINYICTSQPRAVTAPAKLTMQRLQTSWPASCVALQTGSRGTSTRSGCGRRQTGRSWLAATARIAPAGTQPSRRWALAAWQTHDQRAGMLSAVSLPIAFAERISGHKLMKRDCNRLRHVRPQCNWDGNCGSRMLVQQG